MMISRKRYGQNIPIPLAVKRIFQLLGLAMRKIILSLVILLFSTITVRADVTVRFTRSMPDETVTTRDIEGIPYFNVFELNKVFKAKIDDDLSDQRLRVRIYDEEFVFLLESVWLNAAGRSWNLVYPVRMSDGKQYLPTTFLQTVLPTILPAKVTCANGVLTVEPPVDNTIRRIVIDPGHGGKDPGALGKMKGSQEKKIVLQVAKKLAERLRNELGVEVLLTRDTDVFIPLQQRTRFANEKDADLFISLHINSAKATSSKGVEVFFLSSAKTTDEHTVEALENSVVMNYEGGAEAVKKYDDLDFILMDMAVQEHLEESNDLAVVLQENLVRKTASQSRGVKQAGFYVLKGTTMPSVLCELGFISNRDEEKKLHDDAYQAKLVDAIAEGVKKFKFKYDAMR
jgi:N-acetylmuramoyl-L-alanine amidase